MKIDKILAFVFGTIFCTVLLVLAVVEPHPDTFPRFVFRVVLSLAAAGIGAVIPGLLEIRLPYVRAGGAIGVAIIVYFFNPPALMG
jgi:hypothetical protein